MSSSSRATSESRTDWAKFDAQADDDIDTSDAPPLPDDFFTRAKWILPEDKQPRPTVKVELELDPKILAWFQSQGENYEQRIRAALRLYAEAHEAVV